jgi:hypothetical protein
MSILPEPFPNPIAARGRWMSLSCRFIPAILILLLHTSCLAAQDPPSLGFASEANYLLKAPLFVEWPASAFPSKTSPLRLCLYGGKPFADSVKQLASGESISGRALLILPNPAPNRIPGCHILFLSSLPPDRIHSILKAVSGKPTLTVGETPDFLDQGGIIQFFFADTLHFKIDLDAARRSGLKLNSGFLSLASAVRRAPE